jgi:hypothetical protein
MNDGLSSRSSIADGVLLILLHTAHSHKASRGRRISDDFASDAPIRDGQRLGLKEAVKTTVFVCVYLSLFRMFVCLLLCLLYAR